MNLPSTLAATLWIDLYNNNLIIVITNDTYGVPMGFGPLFFEPFDPNGTGTVMFYAGSPVSMVESRANESGMASLPFVLMGGSNATGKNFYLRVRYNEKEFHRLALQGYASKP